MAKIMEIVAKETKGKSYHTYKYSYDSVGLPSIDYDDASKKRTQTPFDRVVKVEKIMMDSYRT